jgi:hypothetical protein
VFVLDNIACDGDLCDSFSRTFQLHMAQEDDTVNNNAMVATFYDIYEDVSPFYQFLTIYVKSIKITTVHCFFGHIIVSC